MFSRLLLVVLMPLFLVSSGCGLKLGEQNKTEPKVVTMNAGSCLEESKNQLKTFFDGEAKEEQVTAAMGCLKQTLDDFKVNIRGKEKNSYAADEISTLVSKQFIKDDSVNIDDLINEVMKLKVVLVGGTTKVLTKEELTEIGQILDQITPELSKLASHMKIITMKWKPEANRESSAEKLQKASMALELLLVKVGRVLASGNRSYEVSDLIGLAQEVMKLMKSSQENIDKLSKAKILVIKAKRVLIGGETYLKGNEWNPLMQTVGGAFGILLRYKYFYDNLKEEQIAERWSIHRQTVGDVESLLQTLLNFKSVHYYSTEELTDLILSAQDLKIFNDGADAIKLNEKGLKSLFTALWTNILNKPEARLANKHLKGFDLTALDVLKNEALIFINNKISIAEVFSVKSEYKKDELTQALSDKNSVDLKDVIRVLTAKGELNFNKDGYLKVLTDTNGLYHYDDLDKSNLSQMLARILIRSYAQDIERVTHITNVTLAETQFAFDQLKDMIISTGLVEERNAATFIANRFREANLFISVGNGDGSASLEEIHHLVLHILSGVERAKVLEKLSMQKCLKTPNETKTLTELDQQCMLDLYFDESNAFVEMPKFLSMKTEKNENDEPKISPENNKKYYMNLLLAAGHVVNEEKKTVLLGDAGLFPHVVQYVEMIFFTHDENRNGTLEKEEAIKAYPVFKETILLLKKASSFKDLSEPDFLGAYIWLLKNGTPFPLDKMKKFSKDYECNLKNDSKTCAFDWTLAANRVSIGKIFFLISTITKPETPAKK